MTHAMHRFPAAPVFGYRRSPFRFPAAILP
jgi:hypothetical protein